MHSFVPRLAYGEDHAGNSKHQVTYLMSFLFYLKMDLKVLFTHYCVETFFKAIRRIQKLN